MKDVGRVDMRHLHQVGLLLVESVARVELGACHLAAVLGRLRDDRAVVLHVHYRAEHKAAVGVGHKDLAADELLACWFIRDRAFEPVAYRELA